MLSRRLIYRFLQSQQCWLVLTRALECKNRKSNSVILYLALQLTQSLYCWKIFCSEQYSRMSGNELSVGANESTFSLVKHWLSHRKYAYPSGQTEQQRAHTNCSTNSNKPCVIAFWISWHTPRVLGRFFDQWFNSRCDSYVKYYGYF